MGWVDGEWGSTTVEVVVVLPAFMLAVLLAVQVGMVVYAAQTAEAAAQEAVEAARGEPDIDTTGVARARTVLDATGAVADPQIDISRAPDAVTVEVSGVAPQVVPGLGLRVAADATGPVERFVAAPDRQQLRTASRAQSNTDVTDVATGSWISWPPIPPISRSGKQVFAIACQVGFPRHSLETISPASGALINPHPEGAPQLGGRNILSRLEADAHEEGI